MGRADDDARALAEAASIEAFLDARLPPGDAGFPGWTRAAAAGAVACARSIGGPPGELLPLLERWAAAPSAELQRSVASVVASSRAGAEPPGSWATRTALELAAAAVAGVGSGWRIGAELAIDSARRSCRDEHERHALESAVVATLDGRLPALPLAPPVPRSMASVPPGAARLPPGWRHGGGFDGELGRERSGVSAPRDWATEPRALELVAGALERTLGARVLYVELERSRTRAFAATLQLELAGPDHVRVRFDRDPRGASEVSIVVFGDGTEVLFPDLCAALDDALAGAMRAHEPGRARTAERAGLGVHLGDAAQSVTSLLRGRPILPSGFHWAADDAVVSLTLERSAATLEPLIDALENGLAAPGTIAMSVRGRPPHDRLQLTLGGCDATIDAHDTEVRIRAPKRSTVATLARLLAAACAAAKGEGA